MNGIDIIKEILTENEETVCSSEEWDNVHSQTWHDSWRDSHSEI